MIDRKPKLSRFRWFRVASFLFFVLFGISSLELLSYQFLRHQLKSRPHLFEYTIDEHMTRVTDQRVHGWLSGKRAYRGDDELGWVRSADQSSTSPAGWTLTTDDIGARVIPGQRGDAWLSTYGDSFTECVEVNDDETWQAYMVGARGGRVLNFGVAGFGPDQALLYLERNIKRGIHTPVVVLAVIEEDLDRSLNAFRPFYTWPRIDLVLGFKPRFVPDAEGGFVLHQAMPESWDEQSIRTAMQSAADIDYYYPLRVETIGFPYSVSAAKFIKRQGWLPRPWLPRETPLARSTLSFILERFTTLAREHGFTPVLVLLPSSGNQIEHAREGYQDAVSPIVAASAPEGLVYINVLEALVNNPAYLRGLTLDQYSLVDHASPEGNAAVARVLSDELAPWRPELNRE